MNPTLSTRTVRSELRKGDVQRAGRLWGAFERLETEEALRLFSEDRTWYERFILTVEDPAFATATQTGRRMDVNEALTYALSSDCHR